MCVCVKYLVYKLYIMCTVYIYYDLVELIGADSATPRGQGGLKYVNLSGSISTTFFLWAKIHRCHRNPPCEQEVPVSESLVRFC